MMHLVKTIPAQVNKIVLSSVVLKASNVFVFGMQWMLTAIALYCVVNYGRNIPLAEDWLLVAPYTGNEPDILSWLWKQNNEHRIPLPKLVILALLKLTNGDFRAGMYFNVLTLSGISLAIMLFLRNQRGYTHVSDAFFPLLLLHLGNWENMVWSWQLSFVLPTALLFAFLLIILKNPSLDKPGHAFTCGIILVLLPLCGGNGVLLVPFLGAWLVYCGVCLWKKSSEGTAKKVSFILLSFTMLAVMVCILYFVGYQKPAWHLPNPGIIPSILTSGKFLAYSLGPVARYAWGLFFLVALVIVLMGFYPVVKQIVNSANRHYNKCALALILFFLVFLSFALVIGWGRAAQVATETMPVRYVIFSSPILCIVYFSWELYGPSYIKPAVLTGLMAMMLVLLPLNANAAFYWRDWYVKGMKSIESDITAGFTKAQISSKHKAFLIQWWNEKDIIKHIQMLQHTSHSPFAQIKDKPASVTQEE